MTKEELLQTYFYIEDISGSTNTISITKNSSSAPTLKLDYSTDGITWTTKTMNSNTTANTFTIPANGKLYLRGVNNRWCGDDYSYYNKIYGSGRHNVGGNIMSLLYGSDFKDKTTFPTTQNYVLCGVFYNDDKLININDLQLPATTLTPHCYRNIFQYCKSLISVPQLPALTMVERCYSNMFLGCSSLTVTPQLPSMTLASYCYNGMFAYCTSLQESPILPATTLAYNCYTSMFAESYNVNKITALFIDISTSALTQWTKNVSSTGTFVMNPEATYNPDNYRGVNGIPTRWTVTTYEVSPEATLETTYFYIKNESENENTIIIKKKNSNSPTLNISYSSDMNNWSSSLSTTVDGININLPIDGKIYFKCTTNNWNSNNNINLFNYINCTNNYSVGGNIMSLLYGNDFLEKDSFPNTDSFIFNKLFYKSLNLISCKDLILPVTKLNDYCYSSMFFGCRNLIDTPTISATTLANGCYKHMFTSCVSLTELPTLNITNLTNYCYHGMFMNCDNISSISLPNSNLANYCYSNMFLGSDNLKEATINTSGTQNNSLNGMFKKCSTLNKVTIPYDNNINSTNLTNWLKDVAEEGNFIYKSSATQTESVVRDKYLVPNNWSVTRTS
jgi:hypothetical protein